MAWVYAAGRARISSFATYGLRVMLEHSARQRAITSHDGYRTDELISSTHPLYTYSTPLIPRILLYDGYYFIIPGIAANRLYGNTMWLLVFRTGRGRGVC
jgi:hypothetical protein